MRCGYLRRPRIDVTCAAADALRNRASASPSVGKSIQSKWKTAPGATFGSAKRTVSTPSAKSEVGPGSHAAPSSFGRQLVSGRSSPRGGTFGKAARHPAPPKKVKVGTQAAPSSVGPQVLSRWSSPPSATFGVSKRPELPSDLPQDIPGPGDYVAPSSFGEQTASQRPNSPRVSMGQKWKERPREEDTVPFYDVPGTLTTGANAPAARFGTATRELPVKKTYEITNTGKARAAEAFGSQVLSDRRNAPAVSFGSRPATKPPSPTGPDPGAYASPGALGRQIRSGRPSSAAFSFGTSRRPGDSGRANARSKVGPGLYKPPPSVGAQVLSGRKNAAAISFGVRWREPKPADEVPGPGAYAAPSSLGGPRSTFGTATREAALAAATGRRPLPQRPTTAASTRKRRSPRQRPGTAGARVSKQRDASGSTQREPTGTSAAA